MIGITMISAISGSVSSKEASKSWEQLAGLTHAVQDAHQETYVLVGFRKGIAVCCHICDWEGLEFGEETGRGRSLFWRIGGKASR
jgi:hypothetical protein